MIRIAINGFGRIGRQAARIIFESHPEIELVAINDLTDVETLAHLFKYDSVYGKWNGTIEPKDNELFINNKPVMVLSEKDPAKLPWKKLKIDVVIESTGFFTDREGASKHISAGAKKVVISANSKDADISIVLGVNQDQYNPQNHHVIANCSCTTNAAAPVMKILHDSFTVKKAFMTTVHAVTATQNLVDGPSKDLRRSRAAFTSIIPETTGAAAAVVRVLPELKSHITGSAYRVPVLCGSIVEIIATITQETSAGIVNDIFRTVTKKPNYKGIIEVSEEEIVSTDVIGTTASAIIDLPLTEVIDLPNIEDENLIRVAAWYDNEWGYSNRLVELAEFIGRRYA